MSEAAPPQQPPEEKEPAPKPDAGKPKPSKPEKPKGESIFNRLIKHPRLLGALALGAFAAVSIAAVKFDRGVVEPYNDHNRAKAALSDQEHALFSSENRGKLACNAKTIIVRGPANIRETAGTVGSRLHGIQHSNLAGIKVNDGQQLKVALAVRVQQPNGDIWLGSRSGTGDSLKSTAALPTEQIEDMYNWFDETELIRQKKAHQPSKVLESPYAGVSSNTQSVPCHMLPNGEVRLDDPAMPHSAAWSSLDIGIGTMLHSVGVYGVVTSATVPKLS